MAIPSSAYRHQIWCWSNLYCSTGWDHSACPSSLHWPKASPEPDSLLPSLGLLALPSGKKKKNRMPTDDKIAQPCLSTLLIPSALSQVELYYSISLSLSLSQHSYYVKYGIKQGKAQKQQWSSVSLHQLCRWQSQPRAHISTICIYCISETPFFLMVEESNILLLYSPTIYGVHDKPLHHFSRSKNSISLVSKMY